MLPTIGFSASGYAALLTISLALIVLLWCVVGFLIFWRRSDDWLALLAAFFLVMFSITPAGNNPGFVLVLIYPVLALPISFICFLGQVSISAFFLLFPNGQFIPRWTRLILLLFIIDAFLNNFPSPTSTFETNWPSWLNLLVTIVLGSAIIVSQIYRYRRVSTPLQRQQTKWVLLGGTATVGVVIGLLVITPFIRPSVSANGLDGVIVGSILNIIFYITVLMIPLSIGFSILRYRLYDIDSLINRTLVYSSLTVLLVALYIGLILSLEALVHTITGSLAEYPPAIVASTLVIAALFQPLRRYLQTFIDRRFYRRKYDAVKTVETFSATLRNEVDLSQLSEHLLSVVQETVQPTRASLWLRKSGHKKQSDIPV